MLDLSFTHRELLGARSFIVQAAVLACLVGLFTLIGPFGTYDSIGAGSRLGYWTLALGANWLVCGSVVILTLRLASSGPRWAGALAIAGAALAAAVPGTGVVHTAEILFRPGYEGDNALATIYLGVAVLMMAISFLVVIVLARLQPEAGDGTLSTGIDAAAPATTAYLRMARDERTLPRPAAAASRPRSGLSQDGGSLCRGVHRRRLDAGADALRRRGGGAGGRRRVARPPSYWVARDHVTGANRLNGRIVLNLTGGHEAPVSRGYLAAVRAAGLA